MSDKSNHTFLLETGLYLMFVRSLAYIDAMLAVDEAVEGTPERVLAKIAADLAEQDLLAETKLVANSTDDWTVKMWAASINDFVSGVRAKREAAMGLK